MERVLGGTGGFHGYRRTPPTSSAGGLNNTQNDGNHSNAGADENECIVREQDRFMPIANVIRIMRKILPPHAKISDDAKETIQECVSEYISFITGEANDRCQREQRKTITAEDVLWAMSKLGFDDYIEPLTLYLSRYREFEGDRGSIRGEPLVKRVVDCPLNMAAFGPAFHYTTAHHHHHHGFFGGAPMGGGGGFMNDGSGGGGGSAHGGGGDLANLEPYHQGGNKGIGN